MKIKIFGFEVFVNKKLLAVGITIVLMALLAVGLLIRRSGGSSVIIDRPSDNEGSQGIQPGTVITEEKKHNIDAEETKQNEENGIKVYVVGCVKRPGVVGLKKGQIIEDAVKACGGATPDADLENVNLVYVLNENVMIRIKSKSEAREAEKVKGTAAGPSAVGKQKAGKGAGKEAGKEAGLGTVIVKNSAGAVEGEENAEAADNRININTASLEELDRLDGVGEATARKIIDYRDKNGPFKSIEDIKKVSGIGDSKFSGFKDMITVG